MHLLLVLVLLVSISQSPVALAAENIDELINFSKKKEEVLVVKVRDSSVIVLEDGRRIKLIGIESAGMPPRIIIERDKDGRIIEERIEPTIPLEEQALSYAQDLLEGKKVKLEFDSESTDSEGRRLAYIFLPNGQMANAELLRQGFVYLKIRPPNVKYADQLRNAYQEAKREQRGFLSN